MTTSKSSNTKETKVATDKILSAAEIQKRIDAAMAQINADKALIEELSYKEFNDTVAAARKLIENAGYSIFDVVDVWAPTQGAHQRGANIKTRAKRGTAPAKGPRKDVDATGASPIPGETYALADGTKWTKAANGKGAPKKEFIEAVHAGATWAALKA